VEGAVVVVKGAAVVVLREARENEACLEEGSVVGVGVAEVG